MLKKITGQYQQVRMHLVQKEVLMQWIKICLF